MIIERLSVANADECVALAESREWWPERAKWRLLLEVGIAFGMRDEAGALIGTTIVTRYSGVAVISMVLVAKHREGQGLGRRLMTAALEAAEGDIVCLNATDPGRPLYEKLGFVAVSTTYNHIGTLQPALSRTSVVTSDVGAIAQIDREVMGTDRSHVLRHLPAFTEQLRVLDGGYAGAWRNGDILMVGPLMAASAEDAKRLITDLADGTTMRVDLDEKDPSLREWATAQGLTVRYQTAVMTYNGKLPGDRARWFVPFMQALG